jgi:hypothetical protein
MIPEPRRDFPLTDSGNAERFAKAAGFTVVGDMSADKVNRYASEPQERAKRLPRGNEPRWAQVLDFHSLRHTCGAWLAMTGAHPKAIQTVMRHSAITLTMDTYGHLFPGQEAETVARLPDMLAWPPQAFGATGAGDETAGGGPARAVNAQCAEGGNWRGLAGIGPGGIELSQESQGFAGVDAESGAESGAVGARTPTPADPPIDPDLQVLIDAWPTLPAATRQGIVAMIRFASTEAAK